MALFGTFCLVFLNLLLLFVTCELVWRLDDPIEHVAHAVHLVPQLTKDWNIEGTKKDEDHCNDGNKPEEYFDEYKVHSEVCNWL